MRNACSKLYGSAWRAIRALGYLRAITYTTDYETGAGARAAGFLPVAVKIGRDWNTPSRRRRRKQQVDGVRWEIRTNAWRPGLAGPPSYAAPESNRDQMEIDALIETPVGRAARRRRVTRALAHTSSVDQGADSATRTPAVDGVLGGPG